MRPPGRIEAPTLRTGRLVLRDLEAVDAAPIAAGISEWEVIRWLTAPPCPYRLADAEWFIAEAPGQHWALTLDDGTPLVGVISLKPDLGYWLTRGLHGRGLMREAAEAVLGWHFARAEDEVATGHLTGNVPSRRLLLRLRFADAERTEHFSNAHGRAVPVQRMTLAAAAWRARGRPGP